MKRPLVLVSFVLTALIAVSYFLFPEGKALSRKNENRKLLEEQDVLVFGVVRSFEARGDYSVLYLRNGVLLNKSPDQEDKNPEEEFDKMKPEGIALRNCRVTLDGEETRTPRSGQRVLIRGTIRMPEEVTNPGQFDMVMYDRLHHINVRLTGAKILKEGKKYSILREEMNILREMLLNRLKNVYPGDVQEVLGAMLLGRKEMLTPKTSSLYEAGGVSHMLVISSMHLSLLSSAVFFLLRKCRCPMKSSIVVSGAVLLFYVFLTGCSVSAVRAVLIYLFHAAAKWMGRTYDRRCALAFAAIVMLCTDPCYLFYSSFQLSFLAVILCVLTEHKGKITGAAILQFGMMPLIAYHYYEIPLLGIPVNLILVPFLPVILVTGALGLIAGGTAAVPAVLAVRLYKRFLELLLFAPDHLTLPGNRKIALKTLLITGRPSVLRIIFYYLIFALFLLLLSVFRSRKKKLLAYPLLAALLFVLTFSPKKDFSVTFLDVGQGDCIAANIPGGPSLLIDGGSSTVQETGRYRILPFLKSQGIRHLDAIAVTHADADHISGILEILEMMGTRETALTADYLLLPAVTETLSGEEGYRHLLRAAENAGVAVRFVKAGDHIGSGMLQIRVLGPDEPERQLEMDPNAQCIVLGLSYGAFDVLLTGDVCGEGEEKLVRTAQEEKKTYEVLKAAHHGSRNSTPESFLAAVSPDFAVISCGKNNRYGHPHKETLQRLKDARASILTTPERGAVTFRSDGEHYSVRCYLKKRDGSAGTVL